MEKTGNIRRKEKKTETVAKLREALALHLEKQAMREGKSGELKLLIFVTQTKRQKGREKERCDTYTTTTTTTIILPPSPPPGFIYGKRTLSEYIV